MKRMAGVGRLRGLPPAADRSNAGERDRRTAIGGWPAIATFAAASVAGVWIAIAAPDPVATLMGVQGYDLADLMPGLGTRWEEAG
jgi:hypothetical protein